MPLFAIIFGDFTDSFGDSQNTKFAASINELSLKFTYIVRRVAPGGWSVCVGFVQQ